MSLLYDRIDRSKEFPIIIDCLQEMITPYILVKNLSNFDLILCYEIEKEIKERFE